MSVVSDGNKLMLWQLLANHPLRRGDEETFRVYFNEAVISVHRDRGRYQDLTAMNKQIILLLSKIKQVPSLAPSQLLPREQNAPASLEARVKSHEDELVQSVEHAKPADIDFRDTSEGPPTRNVDNAMKERENELHRIMGKYDSPHASKWLSNGGESDENIKIDHTVSLPLDPVKVANDGGKKVTFHVQDRAPAQNEMSFLSKLKKKAPETNYLPNNKVDIVIRNQEEILGLLRNVSSKLEGTSASVQDAKGTAEETIED